MHDQTNSAVFLEIVTALTAMHFKNSINLSSFWYRVFHSPQCVIRVACLATIDTHLVLNMHVLLVKYFSYLVFAISQVTCTVHNYSTTAEHTMVLHA